MPEEPQPPGTPPTGLTGPASHFSDRWAVLLAQYQSLVAQSRTEPLIGRALSFALLGLASWMLPGSGVGYAFVVAAAVAVAAYWWVSVRTAGRRLKKLEELLLPDTEPVVEVLIQWRHDDWKHPQTARLLRVEPFLWATLTITYTAVVYLSEASRVTR